MFAVVPDLLDGIKDDDLPEAPDILAASAQIMYRILTDILGENKKKSNIFQVSLYTGLLMLYNLHYNSNFVCSTVPN